MFRVVEEEAEFQVKAEDERLAYGGGEGVSQMWTNSDRGEGGQPKWYVHHLLFYDSQILKK